MQTKFSYFIPAQFNDQSHHVLVTVPFITPNNARSSREGIINVGFSFRKWLHPF